MTEDFHTKNKLVLYLHRELILPYSPAELLIKTYEKELWRIRADYMQELKREKRSPSWEWQITDGCGLFRKRIGWVNEGSHNWWHCRQYYVNFRGLDGKTWHGRCVSSTHGIYLSNETLYCRRLKHE